MESKDKKLNRRAESIKHLVSKVMPNFHFPQQCLDFGMWPRTDSENITLFLLLLLVYTDMQFSFIHPSLVYYELTI